MRRAGTHDEAPTARRVCAACGAYYPHLAHEVKDPDGRAYNRTAFLEGRRKMMQAWADYLDGLRSQRIEPGDGAGVGAAA